MRSKVNLLILSFMALAMGIVFGCSSGSVTSSEADGGSAAAKMVTDVAEGRALYASKCVGCHGNIDATDIATPTSFSDIRKAISGNRGGMGIYASMNDKDVQALTDAINSPGAPAPALPPITPVQTAVTPPATLDGAAIYASRCAACHGVIASSNKIGTTIERVQTAIVGNVGRMGSLSTMTALEVQAVVASLNPPGSTPAPLVTSTPSTSSSQDGATLYSANCAGCHGALASSGKAGATTSRIQNAINGNVGNMGYLSILSTAQVTAIAAVLTTAAPPSPTDGPGLYAANCASCHRSLANSEVRGESAGDISEAIRKNKGGMGTLSSLTSGMINAIANALKEESDDSARR